MLSRIKKMFRKPEPLPTPAMQIQPAIRVVWGIPKVIKPIYGLPPGTVRLRFRAGGIGHGFIRTLDGIRHFRIEIRPASDENGEWYAAERGRNVNQRPTRRHD